MDWFDCRGSRFHGFNVLFLNVSYTADLLGLQCGGGALKRWALVGSVRRSSEDMCLERTVRPLPSSGFLPSSVLVSIHLPHFYPPRDETTKEGPSLQTGSRCLDVQPPYNVNKPLSFIKLACLRSSTVVIPNGLISGLISQLQKIS